MGSFWRALSSLVRRRTQMSVAIVVYVYLLLLCFESKDQNLEVRLALWNVDENVSFSLLKKAINKQTSSVLLAQNKIGLTLLAGT